MTDDQTRNYSPHGYPIVGRDSAIDLDKYLVRVHGRDVIDYELLKREEPELYQKILNDERASNLPDNRD